VKRWQLAGAPTEAQLDEIAAMPSPDGKWILFLGFAGWPPRADAIYRMPAKGGKPEQVPTHGVIEEFHCPVASSGTCVLREAEEQKEFIYYALDPVSGMGRELARTPWEPNILGEWSLSPDSSTVAVTHHDPVHPAIQLIHFTSAGSAKITGIPVEGFGTLLGAGWSQNAQGLFVESRTQTGYQLLYVPLHGAVKVLQ